MRVVIDIEANALKSPTKIWLIVCKDIDTGKIYIFRNLTDDTAERQRFVTWLNGVSQLIGHNILGYDMPHVCRLLDLGTWLYPLCLDTLIISKLVDYSRQGHSVEDYGLEFGLEKIDYTDFSKWTQELEDYCIRDVEITHKIYLKYIKVILSNTWLPSITLEHKFQLLVNNLENNGFSFNQTKASKLLTKVTDELSILDQDILKAFPPREVLIREFTPRETKHGTISRTSVPRQLQGSISEYEVGRTYRHTRLEEFNPSSHKQIVEVLCEAGWCPTDKTQTHINTERELQRLKYGRQENGSVDIATQKTILEGKLEQLRKTGWKVNETNLLTLPDTAPTPARLLAKRILLESRRRTLTEWLSLVDPTTSRIHGKFYGIGAWTHRMAHQKPNTANIPNEFHVGTGLPKILGKEMRQLWQAPKNRLLVGVDAEAIQLRVFAHYIDDPDLTNAIVNGKKSDKTDPHSFNQRVFGKFCKTRNSAKHSLYAIFFGGGPGMVAHIMACEKEEAKQAINNLVERYPGLRKFENEVFPLDARRGYFIGLDGRKVSIPSDTVSGRKHLCMSGYLQNGEAVTMKLAAIKWHSDPEMLEIHKEYPWYFVDMVHDEWQTEVVNNMQIALRIAEIQANSLKLVGEELGLKCPLAGSYYNEDHKDYTIGSNWYTTH